jgi:hypothetical protein
MRQATVRLGKARQEKVMPALAVREVRRSEAALPVRLSARVEREQETPIPRDPSHSEISAVA